MLALILCGLFSDHLVLQRDRENPLWGKDTPAQVVTLTVEGAQAPHVAPVQVVTDAEGRWKLLCPELPVGGPYRLHVVGSTEKVIDDVLVGDVWVASGQSNMEFPLSRAKDADREIQSANDGRIRFIKVPQTTGMSPVDSVSASWETCVPEHAGKFSAVAYFFAREVSEKTGIPIGVIDTTWGGTPIEAWISREGLRPSMPDVDAVLDRLAANGPEIQRIRADYQARVAAWEKTAFPQDTENKGEPAGWAKADFDDGVWRSIKLPNTVQSQGLKANGVFWFRRSLEIPDAWKGLDLELSLGAVDDFDTTYFNGERVGATGAETLNAYQVPRHYRVPARLVRPGSNTIAVRVFDHFGDGGFMGPVTELRVRPWGEKAQGLSLAGLWRWTTEREIPLVPASVYASAPAVPPEFFQQSTPASLYNGMIAPLIPYGVHGFIWYQGETNVYNHEAYRDRMIGLIRDWRGRWGQGTLPFYFVQLAAYRQGPEWPYLREAQSAARSEPGTGMAMALDVGNENDIHPKDKQTVGHRLALLALAGTYGIGDVSAQGPHLASVAIAGKKVSVRWADADGLKTSDGGPARGFALAGPDGRYFPASATVSGCEVVLSSPEVPEPRNVRYGWADFLEVNLQNGAGLPAEPFRTDNTPLPRP